MGAQFSAGSECSFAGLKSMIPEPLAAAGQAKRPTGATFGVVQSSIRED